MKGGKKISHGYHVKNIPVLVKNIPVFGPVFGQETSAGEKKTELLVMRNLRCGSSKHRFLDIKIGQKTAQVRRRLLS